jgi:hypothetical protein
MRTRPTFSEHDVEPVRGLPGPLPAGETILWQGSPSWAGLAARALHLRGLALYFALLALWRGAALTADGAPGLEALTGALFILTLGVVPLALLAGFAWLSSRTTVYTITTRRIVLRTGVALPMTINLPFSVIQSAGVAMRSDGTGDIAIETLRGHRVSWIALWPHARTWKLARPQPMLRAVADAPSVAQLLGRALAAAAAMPVRAVQPVPAGTAQDKAAATVLA